MYYVAVKYKGQDKSQLSGPFDSHHLAEQAVVNLLARSDVDQTTIVDAEELDIPEEKENADE